MERSELKDRIIRFISESSENDIQRAVAKTSLLMTYYRCAMLEIETKFKVLDEQFSLNHERNPIESIKTRLKSMESISEKLIRNKLPVNVASMEENLNDVAGVRVICSFIDDIYMLAECLANQDDVRVLAVKDYIKNPKPNGYRSLHMIVEIPIFLRDEKKLIKVEVQLRTIAMESWARLEHRMRYKKNLENDILEKTKDELLECARISGLLDEKMQAIRDIIEK